MADALIEKELRIIIATLYCHNNPVCEYMYYIVISNPESMMKIMITHNCLVNVYNIILFGLGVTMFYTFQFLADIVDIYANALIYIEIYIF